MLLKQGVSGAERLHARFLPHPAGEGALQQIHLISQAEQTRARAQGGLAVGIRREGHLHHRPQPSGAIRHLLKQHDQLPQAARLVRFGRHVLQLRVRRGNFRLQRAHVLLKGWIGKILVELAEIPVHDSLPSRFMLFILLYIHRKVSAILS